MLKHKGKTRHRAKTSLRRRLRRAGAKAPRKTKPDFRRTIVRKNRFGLQTTKGLLVSSRVAGN